MDPKKGLTTVTVNRCPRRSFIPPRRVTDDGKTSENEPRFKQVPYKKKRDLGPLFSKILKSVERSSAENAAARIKDDSANPPDIDAVMSENRDEVVYRNPNEKSESSGDQEKEEESMDLGDSDDDFKVSDSGTMFSQDRKRSRCDVDEEFEETNSAVELKSHLDVEKKAPVKRVQFGTFKRSSSQVPESNCDDDGDGRSAFSQLPVSQVLSQTQTTDDEKEYYEAVYAKASTRKHKKFESDGFIVISKGSTVSLKDSSGKTIESSNSYKLDSEHLEDGKVFKLGGREVQVSGKLDANPFSKNDKTAMLPPQPSLSAIKKVAKLPNPSVSKPFISPCAPGISATVKMNKNPSKPMFNPDDPDALVMPVLDPSEDVQVVVDPHLSRHLREHQREGVSFLYKCVMDKYYCGAILGDEMGLGKTLQCITLLWTLIKQGPYQRKEIIKRALIIAPSSLVSNWDKEFHRWLGFERIRVFAVNSDRPLKHCPPQCPVIIMSYEMATRSEDALKKMRFDIIVCDEAHKIKNRNGQAYVFLSTLPCKRRILLTGTPVQNDLMELYALVNFANPGVLGSEHEFRKEYEKPIEKYQEPQSTLSEKQYGQTMALHLNNILNNFFLRRTHNVMLKYLPPRVTYVAICKPSKLQIDLYKQLLSSNIVQDCVTGSGNCSAPLNVILALKKLCNHPNLVHPKANTDKSEESLYVSLGKAFPQGYRHDLLRMEDSGKMKVLVSLLRSMQGQKVVVVSHYTQTLDLLENLCNMLSFTFKRLDGSTMPKQRQQIVDQFNNGAKEHIFLLSSKAGGLGLNLQGASNIILYDIDWNPAHDIQAMARCWRPGQKKVTNIYRLITSGMIEERIYHRQIAKQDLSGSVMDLVLSNTSVKFSPQDLKDIFSLITNTDTCLTHDLIECQCDCDGKKDLNSSILNLDDEEIENKPPPKKKLKAISTMAELNKWEHHGEPFENLGEVGLMNASKDLQFVFSSRSEQHEDDI